MTLLPVYNSMLTHKMLNVVNLIHAKHLHVNNEHFLFIFFLEI